MRDPRLRSAPTRNPALVLRAFGDDANQPIRFYLYQDVIEELVFAARYEDRPYGAILVGGFGVEERVGFIEVTGFTGASWVDSVEDFYDAIRPASDAWIQAGEGEPIVGVFLSVPGCEAQVDPEAARLHYSLFNIPFQPLVMLDPRSGKISVSARAPGTQLFNAAFRAVAVVPSAPLNEASASGKPMNSLANEEE